MKRLLLCVLVPAILLSSCTNRILRYDGSRPPLDLQTRIPILRQVQDGYGQPQRFVYGELADGASIPQEGTIELSNGLFAKDKNESDACDDSLRNGATCFVCYLGCFPLVFAGALLYLPVLVATGGMEGDGKEKAISPKQQHARWLAGVVEDRQWAAVLDEVYVSGLSRALGWKATPVEGQAEQDKPQKDRGFFSAPGQSSFFAGISRIVLLDTNLGEPTLLLCARSTIQRRWGTTPRTFETCQRGYVELAVLEDSAASGDALRATLVERARQLSTVQAKELCPPCMSEQ